jgi:hypothetical protein
VYFVNGVAPLNSGAAQLITTFEPSIIVVGTPGMSETCAQSIEMVAGILRPTEFLAYTLKLYVLPGRSPVVVV